jgi:hypothetical protein
MSRSRRPKRQKSSDLGSEPFVDESEVIHTGGSAEKGPRSRDPICQSFQSEHAVSRRGPRKNWTEVVHVGVTNQLLEIVENAKSHMEAGLIGIAQC